MSRIPVQDNRRVEIRKRKKAESQLRRETPSTSDINAIITQYLIDNPVGGGSVGKIVAFESGIVGAGASGSVLTRTAAAGQYFKLTHLLTASASDEVGVTLSIDGVDIFSNKYLSRQDTASTRAVNPQFGICKSPVNTTGRESTRVLDHIYCKSFTLTKVSGSTTNIIDYAYETLEAL